MATRRRVGDVVRVDLDWARRLALMRTHTALHALCGVVWRDYGALVTGGNMEPGAGRMDFEFERMSGDLVDAIEATRQRRAGRGARRPGGRPAPRRGVRHPGPHPDQGQPAARGDRGDPHDRDRRARPPGRRRDARRQHARGRRDQGRPATRARAASTSGSGSSSTLQADRRSPPRAHSGPPGSGRDGTSMAASGGTTLGLLGRAVRAPVPRVNRPAVPMGGAA